MRPNAGPLSQVHACRCGDAHPAVARIAGFYVLVCPKEHGDHLRLVPPDKALPGYLVVGEKTTPALDVAALLAEYEARIAALEKKRGAKE